MSGPVHPRLRFAAALPWVALALAMTRPVAQSPAPTFPFVLDPVPVVHPGAAGDWDAGGVFGPKVWRSADGPVLLYVGMQHSEPFDNALAVGAAVEGPGGVFTKYPGNPVLRPGDLHDGATGIEAVALTAADDRRVTFVATLVDARRRPVGYYRVTLALPDWRMLRSTRLQVTSPSSAEWNGAFYIPGTLDPAAGLVIGEGTQRGRPWALGAQALSGDSLVWVNDPATRAPFALSDPLLEPTPAGWDRQGVFNPSIVRDTGRDILFYAGAPGEPDLDEARHTIGFAIRRDGRWMKPAGDGRLIAPRPGTIIEHPALLGGSGNGQRLFVSVRSMPVGRYAIHVATGTLPQNGRFEPAGQPRRYTDTRARWLPDGTRIVFQSDRSGNFDLYSVNTDGTDLVRITSSLGDEVQPAVSPDGGRLAYAANTDRSSYTGRSRYQIYVSGLDGSGAVRLMTSEGSDFFPVWSPDGAQLAFMSDRTGVSEVYVASADGGDVRAVTIGLPGGSRGNPAWSPDGSAISFDTPIADKSEIVVVSLRDRAWRIVSDGLPGEHWFPSWSPDGREIAFGTFLGNGATLTHRVSARRLSDGRLRHLTPPTPPGSGRFDYHQLWSPDGRHLIFASNRTGVWRLHLMNADGADDREVSATGLR